MTRFASRSSCTALSHQPAFSPPGNWSLGKCGTTAALVFFLPHGVVKVGLVIALLRQKLWAYPWALVAFVLFLIYQIYLVIVHQTFLMGFLVVLDIVIIWLVWREWQKVTGRMPDPTA